MEPESKTFSTISLVSGFILFLAFNYLVYQILVGSGHPLFNKAGEAGPEMRSGNMISLLRNSLFYIIPLYVLSLGSLIMAYIKKEKAVRKILATIAHGFLLIIMVSRGII